MEIVFFRPGLPRLLLSNLRNQNSAVLKTPMLYILEREAFLLSSDGVFAAAEQSLSAGVDSGKTASTLTGERVVT